MSSSFQFQKFYILFLQNFPPCRRNPCSQISFFPNANYTDHQLCSILNHPERKPGLLVKLPFSNSWKFSSFQERLKSTHLTLATLRVQTRTPCPPPFCYGRVTPERFVKILWWIMSDRLGQSESTWIGSIPGLRAIEHGERPRKRGEGWFISGTLRRKEGNDKCVASFSFVFHSSPRTQYAEIKTKTLNFPLIPFLPSPSLSLSLSRPFFISESKWRD